MNYRNLYENAIAKYKTQILEDNVYTEKHHIVPRHKGGDDTEMNLIVVSYRQHILLHLLLWKIDNNPRDKAAYQLMSGQKSSIEVRRELQRLSKLGKPWTDEQRDIILEGRKEWLNSESYLDTQRQNQVKAIQKKIEISEQRSLQIMQNAERNEEWLYKHSNRNKYKFVSPEGLVFESPIFAAKYYGEDVKSIDIENWCKRKKYGWNTIPELAKK